jgi:hypothetical protein
MFIRIVQRAVAFFDSVLQALFLGAPAPVPIPVRVSKRSAQRR